MASMIMGPIWVSLAASLLVVVPLWRVCDRAGLHPALSLLAFLPFFGGLVALVVLALSRWPRTEGPP